MNIAQELERLAKLRADGALTTDEFAKAKSRLLGSAPFPAQAFKAIRRQSSRTFFGLPLWAIAIGADWERGEMRGHARGIFALGDIATGWVACGGLARGLIALGGLAIGVVAFGGGAIGLLAVGGGAVGGIAIGGAAAGLVAIGGGAVGYYALGGGAAGVHTVSALHQDSAALTFFKQYFPWITSLLRR